MVLRSLLPTLVHLCAIQYAQRRPLFARSIAFLSHLQRDRARYLGGKVATTVSHLLLTSPVGNAKNIKFKWSTRIHARVFQWVQRQGGVNSKRNAFKLDIKRCSFPCGIRSNIFVCVFSSSLVRGFFLRSYEGSRTRMRYSRIVPQQYVADKLSRILKSCFYPLPQTNYDLYDG